MEFKNLKEEYEKSISEKVKEWNVFKKSNPDISFPEINFASFDELEKKYCENLEEREKIVIE